MTTPARPSRRRQAICLVLATGLLSVGLPLASASATTASDLVAASETMFHQRHLEVRQSPSANGVNDHGAAPALDGRTDLLETARAWSAQMAASDDLKHNPNLADEVCCWSRVGENVAVYKGNLGTEEEVRAATERLMTAWINSSGHRRNMMDTSWSDFAVGVVIQDGAMWATGVFRTLDGRTSPPGTTYGADGPHGAAPREGSSNSTEPAATAKARDTKATCAEVDHPGYDDSNGRAHDDSIKCASGHGLASGRSEDSYAPAGAVTRAQVMAFLRRAVEESGHALEADVPDYFSDDDGTAHEASANMLAHAGFVPVGDGRLRPNEAASRAFIASVAGRAVAEIAPVQVDGDFFDDDNGHEDEDWINVLAAAGVVTGSGDRAFGPDHGLTRAQMATVLVRTFDTLRS